MLRGSIIGDYHKGSNGESTFSMFKHKFGDGRRSRAGGGCGGEGSSQFGCDVPVGCSSLAAVAVPVAS